MTSLRHAVAMDTRWKLRVLADAAKYDAACASSDVATSSGEGSSAGIAWRRLPDGSRVALLKVLFSNECIYDCAYCVHRVSSDVRRARFDIDELVDVTLEMARRFDIEGLFLSSGVFGSADTTVEAMVEVARRLREEHAFRGYIHLKLVPGVSVELVERAGRFADRLSVNVELPSDADLARYAPQKSPTQIEATMAAVRDRVAAAEEAAQKSALAPRFAPGGQSTQMVVGASPATDRDVLAAAHRLYREHQLRRVYYSAYAPIATDDARLPATATPLRREHRLYQADWLLRAYDFDVAEMTTEDAPNLDLELDPKLVWALRRRDLFPIDLNRASRAALLRVPGLGLRAIERLLRLRKWHALTVDDLTRLRVPLDRVLPFVVTRDHRPTKILERADLEQQLRAPPPPRSGQLGLFDASHAVALEPLEEI